MFALRRKAVQSAGRAANLRTRAYSAESHGAHESASHGHHHAEPVNESLGTSFYLILASFPISIGIYSFSRPTKDGAPANPFSRMIQSYSDLQERWMARSVLHTSMVEQAAFDRNLFQGTARVKHIDLKFPEIFNTGSPYNVPAGHTANIDRLVQHYERVNAEAEEKKIKALEARKA